MADQVKAVFWGYLGWNVVGLLLLFAAARRPKVARLVFSAIFLGAGMWNIVTSLTLPLFYVDTYGHLATPRIAAFIEGPFASNPALIVIPIAIGQLVIGVLMTSRGSWFRLAMVGGLLFLIALASLGVGGAFPFSIFGILAALVLVTTPFDTSLVEDVRTGLATAGQAFLSREDPRVNS